MATRVTKRRLNPSSKSSSFFFFSIVIVEVSLVGSFYRSNMKATKRSSIGAPKKLKRKKSRLVKSIVTYLKSDAYFYAPQFSNSPQIQTHHPPFNSELSKAEDISMTGFDSLGIERMTKKKRKISEKVKEYVKSDCYMYGPMISPSKLGSSSLKGKLQITNLVTMEVSTSTTTTVREENNYRNLRSEIEEQTLHNGRINSPKRALVILDGQRTGLSRETDLSPAISSLPEDKMVKPDRRRVTIK